MLAKEILQRATVLLNDDEHVRWPLSELVDWMNEGVRAIVLAKPSASSSPVDMTLVAGTEQTLPTTGVSSTPLMLVSANRNITATTPAKKFGRVITPIDRRLLDEEDPDWHNTTVTTPRKEVRHIIYDEATPQRFFVYPPNDGDGVIEVSVSSLPNKVVATGDEALIDSYDVDVGLPEPYSVPLLDYVMYRAFLKDDLTGQGGRGALHFQQFSAAIGLKIQVEGATSPNKKR